MPPEDANVKGKVLCVTSNFPRWPNDSTTPFVQHLCEDLARLGWEIDILAPHYAGALKHEKQARLNITRFQYFWPANQQTVCYQGGALINLRNSFWNKVKLPFLVIAEFIAMTWKILRNDYALIHAHWILPQGLNAVILGKLFRIPVVITAHGGDVFGLKGKLFRLFKHWTLKHADAVTANSRFTANAIKDIAPAINSLHIIPMGISIKPLSEKQKQKAKKTRDRYKHGDDPLLIFAGRLVEEKGVGDLLQTVASLKKEFPGTRALILGEGQDRSRFELLARDLDITDMVIFKGWIDHEKVSAYLAAADFFIGPSKTAKDGWTEAQGLTFLEAMAAGTVVIATASGGIMDTVIQNETGVLVEESSPQQISQIIQSVYGEKELLENIINNAKKMIYQKYSREFSAGCFSTVFTQATMAGRAEKT